MGGGGGGDKGVDSLTTSHRRSVKMRVDKNSAGDQGRGGGGGEERGGRIGRCPSPHPDPSLPTTPSLPTLPAANDTEVSPTNHNQFAIIFKLIILDVWGVN